MSENAKDLRVPPPAFPPNGGDGGWDGDELSGDTYGDLELIDVPEEGEVVGMDFDAHLSRQEIVARGDPHVMALIESVSKLAEALRHQGEAGLHATPEMSRFEATLRADCVGYLAGRRANEQ